MAGLKGVKCEIRRKKVLRGIKQRLPLIRTDKQISNQIITIFLDFDNLPPYFFGRNTGIFLSKEELWNTYEDELKKYLSSDKFLFTRSLSNKIKVIFNLDLGGIYNIKLNQGLITDIINYLEQVFDLPRTYSNTIDKNGFTCLGIPNENTYFLIKEELPKITPALSLWSLSSHGSKCQNQNPFYCYSYTPFCDEEYRSLEEIDPRPLIIDQELEEDGDNYKQIKDFDVTRYHYFKGNNLPIIIKSRSKLDNYILRILLCTPQLLDKYDLSQRKLV